MTSQWANNLSRPHIGPLTGEGPLDRRPGMEHCGSHSRKPCAVTQLGGWSHLFCVQWSKNWWAEWDFSLLYLIWGIGGISLVGCNNLEMDIWSLRDCNNIIMISLISWTSLIIGYFDIICLEARHGFVPSNLIFNFLESLCRNIVFALNLQSITSNINNNFKMCLSHVENYMPVHEYQVI